MAKQAKQSQKRVEINQTNARMVSVLAICSAVVAFSLVASRSLLSQRSYQSRVINEKEKAALTLKVNAEAAKNLAKAYSAFVGTSSNVLDGNPAGTGEKDGDNAKIVLDALPSKYDFPALASSLEKILKDRNYKINSITGTDDEVNQLGTASPNPEPVEMPFQISVEGDYNSMKELVRTLERSVRPFVIQKLQMDAKDNSINMTISAKTFYQPAKSLTITTKEIR